MKRSTARKRILTHLKGYRKRLAKDRGAWLMAYYLRTGSDALLETYFSRTGQNCPLCRAVKTEMADLAEYLSCKSCLRWPDGRGCKHFIGKINNLKTVRAKLRWIDKLEKELEQWAIKESKKS